MENDNRSEYRIRFGKRIRNRREQLGLTQDELASRMGYTSKTTISKIESGTNEVPHSKIQEFADALNTSVQYLMGAVATPDRLVGISKKVEEDYLLEAWRKATHDEKMQIYFALKKYGMPEPLKEDTSSSESLSNAG